MFEEELELEKSNHSRPLVVLLLVLVAVGVIAYFALVRPQKPLSQAGAATVVNDIISARGPASVSFRVGEVTYNDDPRGPQYRLLEKAGYVKLQKTSNGTHVEVTPLGESTFAELPEFKKKTSKDGSEMLNVPLANRQIVSIDKITMTAPRVASVEYTWKWMPNKMGDEFDVHSNLVESFNTWDRATLIEKYGVNFYHGDPHKDSVTLVHTDQGWKVQNQ